MKKNFLFAILCLLTFSLTAQPYTKTFTADITFSHAQNVYGQDEQLKCDLTQSNNPFPNDLVIFMHGGGEFQGDKAGTGTGVIWNYQVTQLGVCVASMNYRLANPFQFLGADATTCTKLMNEQLYRAVQDAYACARFFADPINAKKYNINPNRIFFAGISAGAVNSLMCLHWQAQEYGALIDTTRWVNKSNWGCAFQIAGVISLSGAILTSCEIDPTDAPIIAVHGLLDKTLKTDGGTNHKVPYTGIFEIEAQSEWYENPFLVLYIPDAGHTLKSLKVPTKAIRDFIYKSLKLYI